MPVLEAQIKRSPFCGWYFQFFFFLYEHCSIWIKISFKLVLNDPLIKKPESIQIMAWCLTDDKLLYETMAFANQYRDTDVQKRQNLSHYCNDWYRKDTQRLYTYTDDHASFGAFQYPIRHLHYSDVIMYTMACGITGLDCFLNRSGAQKRSKENIRVKRKAPRQWSLWGNPPVTGWSPSCTKGQ